MRMRPKSKKPTTFKTTTHRMFLKFPNLRGSTVQGRLFLLLSGRVPSRYLTRHAKTGNAILAEARFRIQGTSPVLPRVKPVGIVQGWATLRHCVEESVTFWRRQLIPIFRMTLT